MLNEYLCLIVVARASYPSIRKAEAGGGYRLVGEETQVDVCDLVHTLVQTTGQTEYHLPNCQRVGPIPRARRSLIPCPSDGN